MLVLIQTLLQFATLSQVNRSIAVMAYYSIANCSHQPIIDSHHDQVMFVLNIHCDNNLYYNLS